MWLSHRLRTSIRPPTLSAFGYRLIGGRLLAGPHGPVAQLMYQDTSRQRLTLYMSGGYTQESKEGIRFAKEGAVSVYYWYYDELGYALSADMDGTRLESLAASACKQVASG